MRVIRSEDEKVIAAQSNNSKFDSLYGEDHFEYDIYTGYTFSDKKYMNELARDRVYGIANMRPINRNSNMVKERLYQKAIEEASRIKTGGYYNELGTVQNEYFIHDTVPGRLKNKIHDEKIFLVNDKKMINTNNTSDSKALKQGRHLEPVLNNIEEDNLSYETNNNFNIEYKNILNFNAQDSAWDVNQEENIVVGKKEVSQPDVQDSPYNNKSRKNMYDDIMNRVSEDIISNSMSENHTRQVDLERKKLRQEVGVKGNNIPYKKTELFEKGLTEAEEQEDGLVVRDNKTENHIMNKYTNKKTSIMTWVLSAMFMIALITVIYLFVTGKLSFELIKAYISRF